MAPRPVVTVQGIVRHPDGQRLLVSQGSGAEFQRLFGGVVEFGELSNEALAREFDKELGIEVVVGRLLGVLQNRFEFQGTPGHEVVIVHHVLLPAAAYDITDFERVDGVDSRGLWRSLVDPPYVPLYAEGWETLIAAIE